MNQIDAMIDTLVRLRKERGLTQTDLADRLGLSRSTIGDFETAARRGISPSLWVVNRYAEAIGAQMEVRSVR